jgi:hypothetical protein
MTAIYNSTRSGSASGNRDKRTEKARPSDSRSGATGQLKSRAGSADRESVSRIVSRDGVLLIVEERRKDAA